MNELEALRDDLGLGQTEMADALDVSQSTYQRWETAPQAKASRAGLERAKAYYKKKKGKAWAWKPEKSITREEFDDVRDGAEETAEIVRFLLSLVPKESRPPLLPKRFRPT